METNLNEMIGTPIWDLHEWAGDVYEPSEDSFLLLDTIEEDLKFIKSFNPANVLEIGSGSGIIITALALALRDSNCLALDINPFACYATKKTAELNGAMVEVLQSDLVEGLHLNNRIDLLIFNPPYVPSEEQDEKGVIDKAWAGSDRGRSTTDRLFPLLPNLMSNHCVGYFVALHENNPDEMCDILREFGFNAEIVKRRKIIGEKLSVLRFYRKS